MNEWTLPNKLILDANNKSKRIYVYDQTFNVGVAGNPQVSSTLKCPQNALGLTLNV